MDRPGRVSAAALAVVQPVEISERPAPLSELTVEEKQEWKRVLNDLPADWVTPSTYGLLLQLCRHQVQARRVAQLIENLASGDDLSTEEFDRLLKMQERESRAIASLATKMRISQQSSYDKSKKKPKMTRKPWDEG